MNNSEAIEKLRAYLKCQENKVKGINAMCNHNLCDDCDLCYMQGTTSEHLTSIELAIQALEKVKEYQQLEEQDRLIKLPCKVGATVYLVKSNGTIEECVAGPMFIGVLKEEFGKEWFLTREEAEEKLKELRGGEHE